MICEDAYYYKILLMSGFSDGYDTWLDGYLEAENPLSSIVLELSLCGSDINKTISCLHDYCIEHGFDERIVCNKLRLFLKDAYYSKRLSKEEIVTNMYRFAASQGDPGGFESDLWGDMFYMDEYYSLAKDGMIPWENFDVAFYAYLDEGTPIDTNAIWNREGSTKKSLLDRITNLFGK